MHTTCLKIKTGKENTLGDFHLSNKQNFTEHLLQTEPALRSRGVLRTELCLPNLYVVALIFNTSEWDCVWAFKEVNKVK